MNAVLFLSLAFLGHFPTSVQPGWDYGAAVGSYWRGPPRLYHSRHHHRFRGLHPDYVIPLQLKRQRCLASGCICEDVPCFHCSCFAPVPRIRYWHYRPIQHIEVPYGELPSTTTEESVTTTVATSEEPTTTTVATNDEPTTTPGVCVGDNKNVIIQFALVQDVTMSYKPFLAELVRIMPNFLKTLTDEFPETEFAITTFVDYLYLTELPLKRTAYCYKLEQGLTKDHSRITHVVSGIEAQTGGGDEPESSLTGILYSAVDSRIGWAKEKTLRGKKVIKVIALTTDEKWKEKDDPGLYLPPAGHPDPKGDGTDTCENAFPSGKLVKDVLEKRDFYLLGLIAPQMLSTWRGYLDKFGFSPDNSRLIELSVDQASTLAASLVEQFSKIVYEDQCGVAETTEPPQLF